MDELLNIINELTLELELYINEKYEATAPYYPHIQREKECYLSTIKKAKNILEKYAINVNSNEGK